VDGPVRVDPLSERLEARLIPFGDVEVIVPNRRGELAAAPDFERFADVVGLEWLEFIPAEDAVAKLVRPIQRGGDQR
jgi:hypothetical protein